MRVTLNAATGVSPAVVIVLTLSTIIPPCLPCLISGVPIADSIGALLTHIGSPLKVTFFADCWTDEQRLNLGKIVLRKHLWQFVPRVADIDDQLRAWRTVLDDDMTSHQTMVVVDLKCNATGRFLREAEHQLYLNFRWLLVDTEALEGPNVAVASQLERYFGVLQPCPVLLSSEVFLMMPESEQAILFAQVYRVSRDAELRVEDYARWSATRMEELRTEKVTSVRRKNLYGHQLRASMVITNPDTIHHLTDYKDKHIDTITKVNYLLTNCLATYLGATVSYSQVSTWGYYNATTRLWDGMIGELVHDTADLGASPLFLTTDRTSVIQYLAMTSATRSKFIFRSPKLSYTENVFLLPFDNDVWACVIAVIACSSVLLLVALWGEWRLAGPNAQLMATDPATLTPSFRDALLMTYGASCQQGSSVLPRNCSARLITLLTFIVLMFLYASYSASIVALLQSPSTKIRSLEDLLASRLKFGVHDTVFNRYYFTHATEPTRRAIYERKVARPDGGPAAFLELEQGIDRIRQGLYAFHVEQGVGYKVIGETYQEDEKCGLQEIQFLQVVDPYYAIQKNSSFEEHIKIGLFRLNEHGIQYRENAKLYTKKPRCSGGGGKFVPVSLVDVEPAVWIILWGAGLAMGFFLLEYLYHRTRARCAPEWCRTARDSRREWCPW
ncbi:ionotropic receptor 75a-like [Anopheles cruzii]|uniref:ionotropic receptor 75a-like n=1 Tax=Anopheles cruzii TaxID=68878 RepID=UPI0022EC8279|nr:ionotropic receptor 75a-like [Anopheles cruzii]